MGKLISKFLQPFDEFIDNEIILHKRRKHSWFHFVRIIQILLYFLIPFVLIIMSFVFQKNISGIVGNTVFWYGVSIFIIIITLIFTYKMLQIYIDWRFDLLIITNKRIIDVNQDFLFDKKIDSIRLRDVVNLCTRREGFWATILKFGSIDIKTAAEVADFVFDYIPRPGEVIQIIQNLQQHIRTHGEDSLILKQDIFPPETLEREYCKITEKDNIISQHRHQLEDITKTET